MSDWCAENDRAWQAEQAERHGENTLKARIREMEDEIEDAKATAHERGYYQGKAAGDDFGAAMREYVTRLEAENKALREALKTIARGKYDGLETTRLSGEGE